MRVGFHAPDTVEELAYLVAEAADTRTPLEVMGRGTKREVGRPVQYGAVLSTESLVGIPLYEPSELVLVAMAGTPVAQLEQALAVDPEEWKAEIPQIEEWFAKFGENLPTQLQVELDGLKARLGVE